MKSIIIVIIVSIIVISIILGCLLARKKNITESLLVSPIKLYNGKNSQNIEICEINNKNQNQNEDSSMLESESDSVNVNGDADYITIADYMSIRNRDPLLRPGSELIGKRVRILLPLYSKETVPPYISEEEDIYCNFSSDSTSTNTFDNNNDRNDRTSEESSKCGSSNYPNYQNNQREDYDRSTVDDLSKDSSCHLSKDKYKTLETDSSDKTFLYSNYYLIQGDQCWYDVNIINYSMTNYPCSMHKVEWKNQYGVVESKWVSLHDYEIQVPIKSRSVYFKNEIGNITSKNPYYFLKTEIDNANPDSTQNNCDTPILNNQTQNAYLKKNYFGNISCSSNQDCYKYGSLYCDGGLCSTKYIQL